MSVSFGFKKKIESKVVPSNDSKPVHGDEVDYLDAVEEKVPVSHNPKPKSKSEIVIPLIKKNVYRLPQGKDLDDKESTLTSLEEEAAKEIIQDSKNYLENVNEQGEDFDNLAIPLLLKNKVPNGYETDERLDVSLRPDEATEAQYDQVPVAAFGMAVLRGMGWTPEEGIGKTFKQNTKPLMQNVRPKGLGLGADVPSVQLVNGSKQSSKNSVDNGVDDVTLALKKGANVLIEHGIHKNKYGTVLSMDMNTDRCVIKMAIGGNSEQIGSNCLRVVSKREYERNAKDLSRLSKAYTGQPITIVDDIVEKSEKQVKEHGKRSRRKRSRSTEVEEKRQKQEKSVKTKVKDKEHKARRSSPSASKNLVHPTWVRPLIRVRIIDKKYRNGRYYKEKVVVEDIMGRGSCCCRTEDGKILDDITDSMLETVIPKSTSDAYVVIVHSRKGRHNGKLAKILEKDKDKSQAILQLIEDRDIVLKVGYEDICEFTGNPEFDDMF